MIQECEELLAISVQPFPKFQCGLGLERHLIDPSEKPSNSSLMLSEISGFQSVSIHSLYDGS
jgi:hypothetical protein